jgi:hypothetical protein
VLVERSLIDDLDVIPLYILVRTLFVLISAMVGRETTVRIVASRNKRVRTPLRSSIELNGKRSIRTPRAFGEFGTLPATCYGSPGEPG